MDNAATLTKPTADSIRQLLARSDAAVEAAILVIHKRQTTDERQLRDTRHRNNRGFSAAHARRGSRYAEWIIGMRRDHKAKPGDGLRRQDHKIAARELVLHYVGQLLQVAEEKWEASQVVKVSPAPMDQKLAERLSDDHVMDAIVQRAERDEDRRVAADKARRDRNLQGPNHNPGARVTTQLRWAYQTLAGLEASGTHAGDLQRVEINRNAGAVATGMVVDAARQTNGVAVCRVLFVAPAGSSAAASQLLWVRSTNLIRT